MMKRGEETKILLKKARAAVSENNPRKADRIFKKLLKILEENLTKGCWEEAQYLTTKAEYLNFHAKYFSNNGWEARSKLVEAMDLLHVVAEKCPQYADVTQNNRDDFLKQIIRLFGCIIPENKTHYVIKCPILIEDLMSSAGLGTGISPGLVFREPKCSICGEKILDHECNHIPGEIYDGKVAKIEYKSIDIDHVSIVEVPKDPDSKISTLFLPKQINETSERPFICKLCSSGEDFPKKITYEIFKEIHTTDPNEKDEAGEVHFTGLMLTTQGETKNDANRRKSDD
jgi:hypothetical protein